METKIADELLKEKSTFSQEKAIKYLMGCHTEEEKNLLSVPAKGSLLHGKKPERI